MVILEELRRLGFSDPFQINKAIILCGCVTADFENMVISIFWF